MGEGFRSDRGRGNKGREGRMWGGGKKGPATRGGIKGPATRGGIKGPATRGGIKGPATRASKMIPPRLDRSPESPHCHPRVALPLLDGPFTATTQSLTPLSPSLPSPHTYTTAPPTCKVFCGLCGEQLRTGQGGGGLLAQSSTKVRLTVTHRLAVHLGRGGGGTGCGVNTPPLLCMLTGYSPPAWQPCSPLKLPPAWSNAECPHLLRMPVGLLCSQEVVMLL